MGGKNNEKEKRYYFIDFSISSYSKCCSYSTGNIFIGMPSKSIMANAFNIDTYNEYKNTRRNSLTELTTKNNSTEYEALVVFNEYLNVKQINSILNNKSLKIKDISLAEPGVQGSGGATVFNNDVEKALKTGVQILMLFVKPEMKMRK